MRPPAWLYVAAVGALAGLVFAGVSTYDFVQHLDRQVHSLHCSFIPGAGATTSSTGCQAAMMSSYSSVFRTSIWGGIPISLAAMSVFAFILFYILDLIASGRTNDSRATAFLALAAGLPAATSILMLIIALTKLGTTCKLCVGVYIASALCLTGAIGLWRRALALRGTMPETIATAKQGGTSLEAQVEVPTASTQFLAGMFGVGVAFVGVPILIYALMAPDHSRFIGTCGELAQPQDTYSVMVPVQHGGPTATLEILDPLCPACKAFEQRLGSSGLGSRMDRKAILFPLDTTCNWMITENTHPGACAVSEAVLCAGDKAPDVIKWAFEVQDRVRAETKADPGAAERIVKQRFPELAACVGSPEAKSRLNKSLRWAVSNNIRVLTPQLFIDNVKLCDEDVDLGLEYALTRMLDGNMPARTHMAKPAETGSATKPTGPAVVAPPHVEGTTVPPPPTAGSDKAVTSPSGSDKPATPAGSDKPPSDKPPGDKPPTDKPPGDKPPSDKPPSDKPPSDKPTTPSDKPADKPPADKPAEKPTAGSDTGGAP